MLHMGKTKLVNFCLTLLVCYWKS